MNELTNKEKDLHKNANVCWICKKNSLKIGLIIEKSEIMIITLVNTEVRHIHYVI